LERILENLQPHHFPGIEHILHSATDANVRPRSVEINILKGIISLESISSDEQNQVRQQVMSFLYGPFSPPKSTPRRRGPTVSAFRTDNEEDSVHALLLRIQDVMVDLAIYHHRRRESTNNAGQEEEDDEDIATFFSREEEYHEETALSYAFKLENHFSGLFRLRQNSAN